MNPLHRLLYYAARGRWTLTRPIHMSVRVLLVRDGRILLLRHTYVPHWYPPGGCVARGETLEHAARRECLEEVGANLGPVELFGIYDNFWSGLSDRVAVFLCRDFVVGGETDWEIEQWRWFPLEGLPEDLSPGTARRLQELKEGSWPLYRRW